MLEEYCQASLSQLGEKQLCTKIDTFSAGSSWPHPGLLRVAYCAPLFY